MAADNIRMSTRIKAIFDFTENLAVEDDILLKEEYIVIPTNMRPDMLNHMYSSHQGLANYTLYARNTIYWPGMNKYCHTCLKYA